MTEIKLVLEADWKGKSSEVEDRLRKVLEAGKLATTRIEKQVADADELNA